MSPTRKVVVWLLCIMLVLAGLPSYCFAGSDLIAFERSSGYGETAGYGRRFVLRDHLGSTSVIVNGSGVRIWEDRNLPFGDVRFHSDTVTNTVQTQTLRCTQGYTGQWLEEGLAASPENWLDLGYSIGGKRLRAIAHLLDGSTRPG